MPYEMQRDRYAALYGPTAGDRIRLGDTNLVARVERNLIPYGSEAMIGAGRPHHAARINAILALVRLVPQKNELTPLSASWSAVFYEHHLARLCRPPERSG